MANNPQLMGPNHGNRSVKTPSIRLSDVGARTTTDYAEILVGDGAPSGGYGRHSGATMLYLRKDASGVGTAIYVTVNGGTNWTAMDPAVLSSLDLNGAEFILDADADTSITADTDDEIDIKIAGADNFKILANIFRALAGSSIQTNTIDETTAGSGVTVDGVLVKDGGATLQDSTTAIADNSDATKKLAFQVSGVTTGTTRTWTVPDQDLGSDQFMCKASGTISAAALRTLNATPVSMIATPGAGKYIKVLWVHWFLDYGGVQMDAAAAGDTLVARYTDGSGAAVVDAVAGDTIGGVTADYHTTVLAVPEVVPVTNAAIVAHINTGEWYAAAGTSELKFLAYYQVVTLPT